MNATTPKFELVTAGWVGTPDGGAPDGYDIFAYLDLAWLGCGFTGECPETFDDEATALRVAAALREDKHGVMPRMIVREALTGVV